MRRALHSARVAVAAESGARCSWREWACVGDPGSPCRLSCSFLITMRPILLLLAAVLVAGGAQRITPEQQQVDVTSGETATVTFTAAE